MAVSLDKATPATVRNHKSKPASAKVITISDDDLVRHGTLAFEDGYADARDHGHSGFWVSSKYNAYERERYSEGFARGMRVRQAMHSRV